MKNIHLHIISFDVPYPPDYGGAIDVFFRVKALHELGVNVHLHCFEYGRGIQQELEKYTTSIQYYKRKKNIADNLSATPFIVKSRDARHLIRNLLKDEYPILFEGLHTCYYLTDERLKTRIKLVRMHNIEHEYYDALSKVSTGWKKRFFAKEAKKLDRFEPVLRSADHIFAIKEGDAHKLMKYERPVTVLPASTPATFEEDYHETNAYCLYHGNLSVPENDRATRWLIDNVFQPKGLCTKLVVAGKNPSSELAEFCKINNVQLVANPEDEGLHQLMLNARVHVLFSEQSTGVKLKLINALSTSGHVIVNHKMIEGTELLPYCDLALLKEDYQDLVHEKLDSPLSPFEFEQRQQFLRTHFDTKENCKVILDAINA